MYEITRELPDHPPERRGMKPKYPFAALDVGEGFFVPAKTRAEILVVRNRLNVACNLHGKKLGRTFGVTQVDDGVFARRWA